MNTLVIYFSQTGITAKAAKKIAEIKGSDLVEIKPEKPYDMSYWKTIFVSLKEIFTKARPELSMEIPDVLQYDRIMLGCPIWCEKILSKGQVASSAKRQKNSISPIRAYLFSIDYFYRRNR